MTSHVFVNIRKSGSKSYFPVNPNSLVVDNQRLVGQRHWPLLTRTALGAEMFSTTNLASMKEDMALPLPQTPSHCGTTTTISWRAPWPGPSHSGKRAGYILPISSISGGRPSLIYSLVGGFQDLVSSARAQVRRFAG